MDRIDSIVETRQSKSAAFGTLTKYVNQLDANARVGNTRR
jgi:hypothetical protein